MCFVFSSERQRVTRPQIFTIDSFAHSPCMLKAIGDIPSIRWQRTTRTSVVPLWAHILRLALMASLHTNRVVFCIYIVTPSKIVGYPDQCSLDYLGASHCKGPRRCVFSMEQRDARLFGPSTLTSTGHPAIGRAS